MFGPVVSMVWDKLVHATTHVCTSVKQRSMYGLYTSAWIDHLFASIEGLPFSRSATVIQFYNRRNAFFLSHEGLTPSSVPNRFRQAFYVFRFSERRRLFFF